jgi:hypothetical protein
MIDADLRRALLANFPPGTSLAVIAPPDKGYPELLAARGDGAALVALDGSWPEPGALGAVGHVVLEGIDDTDDPVGLLAAVGAAAPSARLFLIVSNAAHLRALQAFFNGAPLARAHPLVHSEIEPLLRASGWRPITVDPIPDESIPLAQPLPFELTTPTICFKINDAAVLERARIRAFIAIADHAIADHA